VEKSALFPLIRTGAAGMKQKLAIPALVYMIYGFLASIENPWYRIPPPTNLTGGVYYIQRLIFTGMHVFVLEY
jgi:hypothetical protein